MVAAPERYRHCTRATHPAPNAAHVSTRAVASIGRRGRRPPPAPGGSTQSKARAGTAAGAQRLRSFIRTAVPALR
ncbi:hypothetical protein NDU88_001651 [Pleurodeles waltl]|uniref:Uncharacterized protein n=1 Tax=Pleurodeles waltl TaxID=8319 RepID=A0AAV7PBU2_PLEWA|nr:hypothetical protein NDU88_001651 [Pleurodeles waltl]